MKTVRKRDVAIRISKKTGITQKNAKKVIDAFISEIINLFREGKRIELRNFGSFFPFYIKPRKYRIPRTEKDKSKEGRFTLKFKASKKLKDKK